MKIAHLTPSYFPSTRYGGPPRALHRLCESLAQAGDRVRVLTTNADGPRHVVDVETGRETELRPGLSVYYARRDYPESVSFDWVKRLPEMVRWADVVHLTAVYNFTTWPALRECRRQGKPLVWSPRGALERWEGSRRVWPKAIFDRISRMLLPGRARLHVTSERERRLSEHRFPGLRAIVIPNGVDTVPAGGRSPGNGTLRLLSLGRLDPKKGIENLLKACASLPSDARTWSLEIAGDGEPRYVAALQSLVRELHVESRVHWAGRVEGEVRERCFREADWLVVPSYTENFCQTVAEALARAVPVIASEGTPWERVREVGCGLWVSNSPEALAGAIRDAGRLPSEEMGIRGRRWMEQEFRWDRVARSMRDAYQAVAGGVP